MSAARVLAVVLEDPWTPASGLRRRLGALLRAAGSAAELTVLAAPSDHRVGAETAAVPTVVAPRRGRPPVRRGGDIAAALVRGRPPYLAYYRTPELRGAVTGAIDDLAPDLVFTHGVGGAGLLEGLVPHDRVLLDLADAEHERFASLARATRGAERVRRRVDARLTPPWFARTLGRHRLVTVCSDHDREAYLRLAPDARVALVPNGVDLPARPRPDPGGGTITFVGNFGYPPNVHAARWLLEEVLPGTRAVDAVRLVGGGPAPRHARAVATGFVPDLAAEWTRATVAVAPVHHGGGTRLKVLDAFAAGVPVVATTFGAAGLGARPGEHYLAADSPRAFARALDRLLGDPALRTRLARAGRELALRFTWQSCTRPLVAEVQAPVREPPGPRAVGEHPT